ncbi:hypothetical protein STCU_00161 [Strigomonas culicis]|uniref:DNA-directed RNA polymerase III subunit RPC5 n=1 Tax=Strigomonas culicis TaxID=28005 RepID=S9WDF3_9TRYP|nr:hypothetical protein STCU_00161 [Strigomonas culicis]|eukprot:EPY37136.1 hypothetical protein STCU_00161 [Strigomonas culicis]
MIFGCSQPFREDEVLATYNVYMTAPSAAKAHVFQFPTRTIARPLEMSAARLYMADGGGGSSPTATDAITPASRLTLRCELDTFGSPSFKDETQPQFFDEESCTTYRYTLQAHPFQPRSDYMLGRIADGGVHLTPVASLHSFMPTAHTALERDGPITARDGPCGVEPPFCSARANAVDNSPMSERVEREMMRQRSAVLNKAAGGAVAVPFYTTQTAESREARRKLVSPITGGVDARPASVRQVQDSLYPPEILSSGGITGGEEHQHCVIHAFASRKSVQDQVYDLLQRCHVLPLAHVLDRVVVEGDAAASVEVQVLDSLKQYGCFMHGVWVSQSSERLRGTAAALRDIALVHFYQSGDSTVSRRDLNALAPAPAQRRLLKEILQTLAVLDTAAAPAARRWRLRHVPADDAGRVAAVQAFARRYPVEDANQQHHWQRRCAQARAHLPHLRANLVPPAGQQQPLRHAAATGQAAATAASAAASTLSTAPTEDELRPIRQYITQLFKEHGVLNKSRAKELILRGREVHCPAATNEMLSLALKALVRDFTPNTWVLHATGEPKVDTYRPLLLDILRTMQTFRSAEVPPRLEEALRQQQSVGDGAAKREAVPPSIIQAVITEVAEFRTGDRLWYLRSGNAMTD